jgi:cell wall-associated NlpC family hydrolase
LLPVLLSCGGIPEERMDFPTDSSISILTDTVRTDSTINGIQTGNTDPAKLIAYSKTLKGIPYRYASTDPSEGFDCSGFITYVFNHFGIEVPRTSVDFTDKGTPINLSLSKPGDLILFTGTDSTIRTVGHMGIITHTGDSIVFIHSTSGKAYGVTETTLNPYYMGRFMKVIRVFE